MRRIAIAAGLALAGSVAFQLAATLIAVLVTKTSAFGAPLAAGSLNLSVARRPEADPVNATIDVALTALVLLVPAYRSWLALGGSVLLGVAVFAAVAAGLPNATQALTHAAWWIIAMLPALVLGLLPRIQ